MVEVTFHSYRIDGPDGGTLVDIVKEMSGGHSLMCGACDPRDFNPTTPRKTLKAAEKALLPQARKHVELRHW